MNDHVEVYVHQKKKVIIVCPKCNLEKEIDIKSIPDKSHRLIRAECSRCSHSFNVSFDFRKYYRKPTNLSGFIFDSSTQESLGEIKVTDVSLIGVGFSANAEFKKNSILKIRFYLDDDSSTEIENEIIIESVRDGYYGSRFVNVNVSDTVLNRYILSK